ncbi:condensin complex subunit 2 [Bacillus rossius redtenbacheri]|uniref:condensin complex subunit 2 n=1 Tax=Bacillus rossius redtenbacheri TaxID=93214 RepID=UPI002FDE731F
MNKSRHSLKARRSLGVINADSPLRRKSFGVAPVASVDLPENDDAAERERISSATVDRSSSISVAEKSTPLVSALSGLTADEMTEHYAKCMKLSSENKITTKNAFSLQLIDYMATVFKKKTFDSSNFQVAGVALDAGAKIYGCRVDNVHEAVLRMAGALAQEKKKSGKGDNEGNEENVPEDGTDGSSRRKKKVRKRKSVLAEDPSVLNAKEDVVPRTDPYFQRFVTSVGESQEGNCNFLNKLRVKDDGCKLLLFPELPLWSDGGKEPGRAAGCDREGCKAKLPRLPVSGWQEHEICSAFSHFSFNNWSLEMEERMSVGHRLNEDCDMDGIEPLATPARLMPDEDYAFDMDAEVAPLEDNHYGHSDDDEVSLERGLACTISKSKRDVIVDVRKHLSVVPQEYSFFKGNLMSLWAGPNHWKVVPAARGKLSSEACKSSVKRRRRKEAEVNFDIDLAALQDHFSAGKGVKLSRKTIQLWSNDKTTLPQDEHFDPSVFYRLGLRSCISVTRVDHNSSQIIDDDVDAYNYDNDNDRQSFCPDLNVDDNGQQDDGLTQNYEASLLPSQDVHSTDMQPTGTFTGDNLVAPPQKVAKIWIPYALKAKKMDMKKLKDKIWYLLTTMSLPEDTTPVINPDRMAGQVLFSKVYRTLPSTLSQTMRENLSFPLAMFAALHLANEKSLCLEHADDLSDFVVKQF